MVYRIFNESVNQLYHLPYHAVSTFLRFFFFFFLVYKVFSFIILAFIFILYIILGCNVFINFDSRCSHFYFYAQNEMQIFTTKIVNMAKAANLFASQGGPILLAQVLLSCSYILLIISPKRYK